MLSGEVRVWEVNKNSENGETPQTLAGRAGRLWFCHCLGGSGKEPGMSPLFERRL
jgi:hypothetical protein